MTKRELYKELDKLEELISNSIDEVEKAALESQKKIYKEVLKAAGRFDTIEGRYVVDQDLTKVIATLESRFDKILGETYIPKIKEYLNTFLTIEEMNINIHKSYNELEIESEKLSPARKTIYQQAKKSLSTGLNDSYKDPAKYLLMQQVTSGISIKDSQKVLREWNNGKRVGTITPLPNLQKYATQIARDSSYGLNRSINNVIADEYKLTKFLYVGPLLKDSRPICVHLVNLRRDIELEEMPPLLRKYPEGLRPGTTKDNFLEVAGGFNCEHTCFPVR